MYRHPLFSLVVVSRRRDHPFRFSPATLSLFEAQICACVYEVIYEARIEVTGFQQYLPSLSQDVQTVRPHCAALKRTKIETVLRLGANPVL